MDFAQHRARFDWLVELGGASALGLAAGFAALKASPSLALPGPAAMTASGFACFGLGMLAMRSVGSAPRALSLGAFTSPPADDDELLLTDVADEPLLLVDVVEQDEALLLEDALPEADPASRVVRLFAAQALPTPGELKQRIDLHLSGAPRRAQPLIAPPQLDASQALSAALDELRRSLR